MAQAAHRTRLPPGRRLSLAGPTPRPDSARLYEWECRHVLRRLDQDVGFWVDLARQQSGPVLELACGTGRLTFPLAGAGFAVVGVDNDRAMLALAHRRRHRQPWPVFLAADMRRFALAARFALVFVGYNSLQLLTEPGDMVACLNRAREHLAPHGVIGLEVTDFQAGGAEGEAVDTPLGEADGIRLSGDLVHDLAARTSRYRRRFAGEGWTHEDQVVVRSIDRPELELVLGRAGLTGVGWWEDGATTRAIAAMA